VLLEDLTNFPGQPDWDYNDHHWTVQVIDVDAIEIGTGSIGGVVWDDGLNSNNVRDTNDPRLADVAVALFRNGVYQRTTYTSSTGAYSFTQLPTGSYQV